MFIRCSLAIVVVGEDHLARIHVRRVEPAFSERRRDHHARQTLAEADDEVGGARGQLADDGDAANKLFQSVKGAVDIELVANPAGRP